MNEIHKYEECGLKNIFLLSGFKESWGSRGRTVSIENIEGLHRAIGEWLARDKKFLDGREARFLRLEMRLSQAALAFLLGMNEQAIARLEKKSLQRQERISPNSERMIRFLYLETIGDQTPIREFLQALAELEDIDSLATNFQETEYGWEAAAA